MLKDLIKLANDLDQKGLTVEADLLDKIIMKLAANDLKVFFLIGPPGVGKSTWLKEEGPKHGIVDPYIISMDDVTDMVGDKHGYSYDDMFARPIQPGQEGYSDEQHHDRFGDMIDQPLEWKTWEPKVWERVAAAQAEAMSEHERNVKGAKDSGRPVVVDMTNMNRGARDRMKSELDAPDHKMIAVVFDWNNDVERLKQTAKERNEKRIAETGRSKTIPPEAFDRMTGAYQAPLEDEFDEVIEVPAWWIEDNT